MRGKICHQYGYGMFYCMASDHCSKVNLVRGNFDDVLPCRHLRWLLESLNSLVGGEVAVEHAVMCIRYRSWQMWTHVAAMIVFVSSALGLPLLSDMFECFRYDFFFITAILSFDIIALAETIKYTDRVYRKTKPLIGHNWNVIKNHQNAAIFFMKEIKSFVIPILISSHG